MLPLYLLYGLYPNVPRPTYVTIENEKNLNVKENYDKQTFLLEPQVTFNYLKN